MTNPLNISLIKQAVVAAEANERQGTSSTKTRGQVRGGGRKPWKQKGTGNARAGSRRSPIWVGGGITFGPAKDQNFSQALPKKMARAAFEQLLALLNTDKKVTIADSLTLKAAKTKDALTLLRTHNATNQRVLLVTEKIEPELVLAARNLPRVTVVTNDNLSLLMLARTERVIIERAAAVKRSLVKAAPAQSTTKKTS